MKVIGVTIEGRTPIMFNNPLKMAGRKEGKFVIPSPAVEADSGCYWMPEKESIGIPADNVKASMIEASGQYKAGKIRLRPFVSGSIFLEPRMLSFGTKDYEIDTRRVVVQRQGILRSRPLLPKWKLSFDLVVDEDFPATNVDILKDILNEAGRRLGIGDYRPQKKGWFGKFVVTDWQLQSNSRV